MLVGACLSVLKLSFLWICLFGLIFVILWLGLDFYLVYLLVRAHCELPVVLSSSCKFTNLSLRKNFQIFIKRKNMTYSSLIFFWNLDHSRRLKHALITFAFLVEISWPKVEPCVFSGSKHQKHFLFYFLICYANQSALLILVQIFHTRPSTFYISTSEVWTYYLRYARSVRALLENYSRGHQAIILLNFKDKKG